MLHNKPQHKQEVGFVVSSNDYLLYIEGLPSAEMNDIVVSEHGGRALVTALDKEVVEVMMLDQERPKPGVLFHKSKEGLSIPLGDHLIGRAINPLGVPVDDKGDLPKSVKPTHIDLDIVAPGIDKRAKVQKQVLTGIMMIDVILPVGKGQRELLFGDPRSGMREFCLNVIANQKKTNMICIYTVAGRGDVEVKRFLRDLEKYGCLDYTVVVAGTTKEPAPLISIAISVSCCVADSFRKEGKDVILFWDDLGTQAKYLREIALLSGRIPGRESYPADIFYQHSQFIERAGSFNEKEGGGTVTLFPIIETDLENITALIPTNVMSATDGHILFMSNLAAQGIFPAVEPDESVTRVGHKTQTFLFKVLADKVRMLIAEYRELKKFSQFGGEVSKETQSKLKRGEIAEFLFRQEPMEYLELFVQAALLGLVFTPFFIDRGLEFIRVNRKAIIKAVRGVSEFEVFDDFHDKIEFNDFVGRIEKLIPKLEQGLREQGVLVEPAKDSQSKQPPSSVVQPADKSATGQQDAEKQVSGRKEDKHARSGILSKLNPFSRARGKKKNQVQTQSPKTVPQKTQDEQGGKSVAVGSAAVAQNAAVPAGGVSDKQQNGQVAATAGGSNTPLKVDTPVSAKNDLAKPIKPAVSDQQQKG